MSSNPGHLLQFHFTLRRSQEQCELQLWAGSSLWHISLGTVLLLSFHHCVLYHKLLVASALCGLGSHPGSMCFNEDRGTARLNGSTFVITVKFPLQLALTPLTKRPSYSVIIKPTG